MEEEQQPSLAAGIIAFLTDSMRKVDALILPVIDDEDICGIPEFLEEGKKRKLGELKNEAIAWNIGGQILIVDYDEEFLQFLQEREKKFIVFDEPSEENFDILKGRIKNAIVGEILALGKEEETPEFKLPTVVDKTGEKK